MDSHSTKSCFVPRTVPRNRIRIQISQLNKAQQGAAACFLFSINMLGSDDDDNEESSCVGDSDKENKEEHSSLLGSCGEARRSLGWINDSVAIGESLNISEDVQDEWDWHHLNDVSQREPRLLPPFKKRSREGESQEENNVSPLKGTGRPTHLSAHKGGLESKRVFSRINKALSHARLNEEVAGEPRKSCGGVCVKIVDQKLSALYDPEKVKEDWRNSNRKLASLLRTPSPLKLGLPDRPRCPHKRPSFTPFILWREENQNLFPNQNRTAPSDNESNGFSKRTRRCLLPELEEVLNHSLPEPDGGQDLLSEEITSV